MDFLGKHIVLGVCGGVAAYKACELIRELQRLGATVTAVMTPDAEAFIKPLTLEALTHRLVVRGSLTVDAHGTPWHIALAQQGDALVILPATANTLAKLAHGLADDALTTTAISWTGKPMVIIPAMNTRMWENPLTLRNVAILQELDNVTVVPPTSGELACGESGSGHLAALTNQLHSIHRAMTLATQPKEALYLGIRVVITAGGTVEPLDPVRVLTNRSSGKMGVALADAFFALGASVTLIATDTVTIADLNDRPYSLVRVARSAELQLALETLLPHADVLVMAAAVSDFIPADVAAQKIKRGKEAFELSLTPNVDILAAMVAQFPSVYMVGFAAETHDVEHHAQEKLARKGVQVLCVNDVSRSDIGFNADNNELTVFTAQGRIIAVEKTSKALAAQKIASALSTDIHHYLSNKIVFDGQTPLAEVANGVR
ncbi:MAG: bifunctional phosphopantothenoylcysteine decarboxylase/phosphopantothenate--cysteine ligase CoaBC [Vampirovibrionales bacterium]|nr:bifunctional phosphopantothenoylcysteine decarboxylase/phosphopantothenate--cysteine ligase CoaBC [Vampirovibrionales bacterium]